MVTAKKTVKKKVKKQVVELMESLAKTGKSYAKAELYVKVGEKFLLIGQNAAIRIRPHEEDGMSTAHVQIHGLHTRNYGCVANIPTKTKGLFARAIPADAKGE